MKITGTEEDNRTDKAKHIWKEKQKEYNPGSLDLIKRETNDKRRTDTENGKFRKLNNSETDHADFAMHQTGHRFTNARH